MAKILLADDSRAIRQMVSQTLESAGHDVLTAENGEIGVEIATRETLDLILTDFNMPVLNGVDLTQRVRALPNHKDTPILLVTTESQLAKKDKAKVAGATGWIVKPIPPQRLLEIVSQVLNKVAAV